MFRRIAVCGKVALIAGIIFIILAGVMVYQEVNAGAFMIRQSHGVVFACAGIGLLFFYTMKYLEVKAGNASYCSIK